LEKENGAPKSKPMGGSPTGKALQKVKFLCGEKGRRQSVHKRASAIAVGKNGGRRNTFSSKKRNPLWGKKIGIPKGNAAL